MLRRGADDLERERGPVGSVSKVSVVVMTATARQRGRLFIRIVGRARSRWVAAIRIRRDAPGNLDQGFLVPIELDNLVCGDLARDEPLLDAYRRDTPQCQPLHPAPHC